MMEKTAKRSHPILTVFMWIFIILIFLPVLAVLAIRLLTYIHTHIKTENGIDERTYVRFNNQDQYVTMKGENVNNPVLLYLHGGPAVPDTSLSYAFSDELFKDFTFVTWDQRGCGKTYFKNRKEDKDNLTVTFDQVESDLDCLVNYLCSRFNQEKVILVGHSYGSIIGSNYALTHPEKVSCYIGLSQMVSMKDVFVSYQEARNKALIYGNDTTKMDAAYKRANENWTMDSCILLEKEIEPYFPSNHKSHLLWNAIRSPYAWMDDLRWLRREMGNQDEFMRLNQNLYDDCLNHDVREDGLTYQVPVGFLCGENDYRCPSSCTEEYKDSITAPRKELQILENCGHTPQMEEPKLVQSKLKNMIDTLLK